MEKMMRQVNAIKELPFELISKKLEREWSNYLTMPGAACWTDGGLTILGVEVDRTLMIDKVVGESEDPEEFWRDLRSKYAGLVVEISGFEGDAREAKFRGPGTKFLGELLDLGFQLSAFKGFGLVTIKVTM